MITPRFSCTQTAESVIISIYCPAVRASDVEINVDDTLVTVHINPYFLRLNFTHSLLDDDDASSAKYDPSSGYLRVELTKEVKGQHFDDLDLLAKLLAPRPSIPQPSIEVLSSNDEAAEDPEEDLVSRTQGLTLDQQEFLEAAENDWQLPQKLPQEPDLVIRLTPQNHYGFLDLHTGYFTNVSYTENEVNELGADAERCLPSERRPLRIKHEDEKWDSEHYMADFADDEYILELINWEHPYLRPSSSFEYTEKENKIALNLPKREYIPSIQQTQSLYLTLVTILFAYAYESRTNQHDPTPESAWTICTLVPAFSALDVPPYGPQLETKSGSLQFSERDILSTLTPSFRRSLAFPLYRSFALAEKCQSDVSALLSRGKRTIFRCLLEMKDILDHHEVYYVYSKIWLDDFCVWIQAHASDEILSNLSYAVDKTRISKGVIGWELEEIEAVVRDIQDNGREADSDDE
ncbi:hypothetical protein VNI00_008260 [Paramarasmius palmivorus]|uniref:CS domain-containing protein n=1 Tax=Paramarasmius palmivorus TaxID=297713 RepID=A0AAW0CUT1_9AGAR